MLDVRRYGSQDASSHGGRSCLPRPSRSECSLTTPLEQLSFFLDRTAFHNWMNRFSIRTVKEKRYQLYQPERPQLAKACRKTACRGVSRTLVRPGKVGFQSHP